MVLFLSVRDYAAVGAIFAKCLNEVGVEAQAVSKRPTSYSPSCRAIIYKNRRELERMVERADVIVWMHSKQIPLTISLSGKKRVVFHGGTRYRLHSGKANKAFRYMSVSLIQTAEMLGLGARNEVWMLPAAYIGDMEPDFSVGSKVIVGHFPSAPDAHGKEVVDLSGGSGKDLTLKGSYIINKVMKRYKNKVQYRFSKDGVGWVENLKRVNECDIYIESLNNASISVNKHDWSIAALEAAALGDIVITNFKFGEERYKQVYGGHSLQVANTEEELVKVMDKLLSMSKNNLIELKHLTRDWAATTHGLKAVGLRLKEVFGL